MYQCINLLIGSACNMRCPYCLQTGEDIPANRKADLTRFADLLAEHLKGEMPRRIIIWGGEPMVYWEKIQQLLSTLESVSIKPNEGYFITTNGMALTDQYVDYVNERSIWTTISSHNWSIPKAQWDRIFKLENFSISAIIHHNQITFWDLRRRFYEFEDEYGFKPHFYLHFLRANDGCSPEFYMTKTDVDTLCDHLVNDVITLANLGDDWARWQCNQLLFENRREIKKGKGEKCVRDDRISVDLHGNIYECHHNYDASNICGNLDKKKIHIRSIKHVNPYRFSSTKECSSCEIYEECRGGCYLSNTHEIDCYLARKMHPVYEAMKIAVNWREE